MSVERAGEWREPSPASSYKKGSSSSDDSTSYEEEVLTPRPEKKGRTEEEQDPTYTPEKTGPSSRNSRTTAHSEEGHVSNQVIQCQGILFKEGN
jgi:hypothetical protein